MRVPPKPRRPRLNGAYQSQRHLVAAICPWAWGPSASLTQVKDLSLKGKHAEFYTDSSTLPKFERKMGEICVSITTNWDDHVRFADTTNWQPTKEITVVHRYWRPWDTDYGNSLFGVGRWPLGGEPIYAEDISATAQDWLFSNQTLNGVVKQLGDNDIVTRVYTAGPRGLEIWDDGVLVASSATVPAERTSAASNNVYFEVCGQTGDQVRRMAVFLHEIYDKQLPAQWIIGKSADPYRDYRAVMPTIGKAPAVTGVTVTPAAASITLNATTGSVLQGSIAVTPAASLVTLGANTGSILAGSLAIAPATAQIVLGAQAGSIIAGSLSIAPATALINLGAGVGAVLGGGLVVTPAAALLTLGAQAALPILGSIAVSPPTAQVVLGADGSVVVPTGVVVSPSAAQITLGAAAGSVLLGSVSVTPATAQLILKAAIGATVIPDGVLVAPDRAILTLLASGTAIGGGFIYVSPSPATLTLGAQVGAVITGSLTASPPPALVNLRAKMGYVESQEGWALNLGGQGGVINLLADVGNVNPHGGGDGINEDTGSFCPPNPELLFELFHPANDSEPESLLISEVIKDYGLDERILIRKPSGTLGYMRPLYCRFALTDPEAGTECINEAMISLVFGRMKQ